MDQMILILSVEANKVATVWRKLYLRGNGIKDNNEEWVQATEVIASEPKIFHVSGLLEGCHIKYRQCANANIELIIPAKDIKKYALVRFEFFIEFPMINMELAHINNVLNTDLALQSSKSRLRRANIPKRALVEIPNINIFKDVLYMNLAIMLGS